MQNLKFHYIHFQHLTGKKGRSWGGGKGGGGGGGGGGVILSR